MNISTGATWFPNDGDPPKQGDPWKLTHYRVSTGFPTTPHPAADTVPGPQFTPWPYPSPEIPFPTPVPEPSISEARMREIIRQEFLRAIRDFAREIAKS